GSDLVQDSPPAQLAASAERSTISGDKTKSKAVREPVRSGLARKKGISTFLLAQADRKMTWLCDKCTYPLFLRRVTQWRDGLARAAWGGRRWRAVVRGPRLDTPR